MDVTNDQPGLYLLQGRNAIIPIALRAFTVAQGSKSIIRKKNIGCIVIMRDGQCHEISEIKFLGLYGDGVLRKGISLLTSAYEIKTEFRPATLRFDDVKNILISSTETDSSRGDRYFSSSGRLGEMLSAIADANSYEELFQALHIDDEDQLDVLC